MDPELLLESIEKLHAIRPDDLYLQGQIRVYLFAARRRRNRKAAVAERRETLNRAQSTGVGTLKAFAQVVLAENLTRWGAGKRLLAKRGRRQLHLGPRGTRRTPSSTWRQRHCLEHRPTSRPQTSSPVPYLSGVIAVAPTSSERRSRRALTTSLGWADSKKQPSSSVGERSCNWSGCIPVRKPKRPTST